jgi:hypothetical protein
MEPAVRRLARFLAWTLAVLVLGVGVWVGNRLLVKVATSQGECWFDDGCASGMDCVWWWGLGEGRGGRIEMGMVRSCEHLCDWGNWDNDCPPGTTCVIVLDGPGSTCQKKR